MKDIKNKKLLIAVIAIIVVVVCAFVVYQNCTNITSFIQEKSKADTIICQSDDNPNQCLFGGCGTLF